MHTLTISGASDDVIDISGDIEDEFTAYDDAEGTYVAVSDGTLLSIYYDNDGVWRINRIKTGSATYEKAEPKGDEYSDKVTLTSAVPFTWVVYSEQVSIEK